MKLWVHSVLILFAQITNGYKILFIFPLNTQTHWEFSQNVIKALLNRHHEVTCITSFSWTESKPMNYTEILVQPLNLSQIIPQMKIDQTQSALSDVLLFMKLGKIRAEHILSNRNVQNFLQLNDISFDLVINEEFYMESLSMFSFIFNAPLITISSHGYFDFFDRQFGLFTPWSHVSHPLLGYSDKMRFFERLENTYVSLADWTIRRWIHLPNQMELAKKHFGHVGKIPTMDDLVKHVSVILVNMHRFYLPPRPSMVPSMVYIGGAHMKPKPLSDDLEEFLDGAEDGAIFMDFGTFQMTPDQIDMFMDVLGHLKQRVLWKYNDKAILNVPTNIMVHEKLTQTDILAHPRVILFISHGDMSSNCESIHHGVPMLIIPFFGDQFGKAKRAERTGYAKVLHYNELTTDSLTNSIQEMIENKSYTDQVKYISDVFSDNLVDPMDETIWWIEHVAKFKGAKHLKSRAVNMSWISYFLLDVFFMMTLTFLFAALVLYIIVKNIMNAVKERKRQKRLKLF